MYNRPIAQTVRVKRRKTYGFAHICIKRGNTACCQHLSSFYSTAHSRVHGYVANKTYLQRQLLCQLLYVAAPPVSTERSSHLKSHSSRADVIGCRQLVLAWRSLRQYLKLQKAKAVAEGAKACCSRVQAGITLRTSLGRRAPK